MPAKNTGNSANQGYAKHQAAYLGLLLKFSKFFQTSISIKLLNSQPELFKMVGDVDQWIDIAKECKYLPEQDLKVNKITQKAKVSLSKFHQFNVKLV